MINFNYYKMAASYNSILHHMYGAYYRSKSSKKNYCSCCSPPPWLIFNGSVNANRHPIYNLPEPTTPCSAATKDYVDQKTTNSGSIEFEQDKNTAQKVVKINYDELFDIPPVIVTSLTNVVGDIVRFKSLYTKNISTRSFELVVNMEANFEKIITKGGDLPVLANNISALVNINGKPAVSLAVNPKSDGPSNDNSSLFISNNGTGDAGLTEITPSSGMGTSLGIIGGLPVTVYVQNNEVVYSRCSNVDGTGIWDTMTVISDEDISNVSDPIELNGGVYFLAWHIEENESNLGAPLNNRVIYSCINSKFDGSDIWQVTKVGNFGGKYPVNSINPIAFKGYPGFAVINSKSAFYNDVLLYYQGNDSLGTTWTKTKINIDIENTGLNFYYVRTIVTPNNQVAIYYIMQISRTGKINLEGQVLFDKFVRFTILTLDNTPPPFPFGQLSVNVVNGNVAICYFMTYNGNNPDLQLLKGNNIVYQYSDPSGFDSFTTPVVLKKLGSNDFISTNNINLADINNAPTGRSFTSAPSIVAFIQTDYFSTDNKFVYFRGGDPSTFVDDSEINANYTLN